MTATVHTLRPAAAAVTLTTTDLHDLLHHLAETANDTAGTPLRHLTRAAITLTRSTRRGAPDFSDDWQSYLGAVARLTDFDAGGLHPRDVAPETVLTWDGARSVLETDETDAYHRLTRLPR